ncbi:hypothetical protein DMB66_23875 [Actinoplanes sp. ATCC 53533]|uniref:hypothetical protein n=1 Tax=Actinoplanes sp. ATCC 53533 TaxID=1288362 RepID=UPI000F7A93DD|nr:hypothetical protein [Actinoplanes sp. ATCC 53533]RSM61902.1 hypothetical protein DMB66_23875 [Actinoplanes sp. ATCC 53533]
MSPDSSGDIARVAAGLRNEFRSSDSKLREDIRRIGKAAEKRAQEIATRLDAIDERVGALVTDQAELRRQVQRKLDESGLRVGRIEQELQLLEGLFRRQRGEVPVDLDSVPAELGPLVEDVRQAERIRSTMLSDDARAACQAGIDAFERRERTLAETRQRAVAASRKLAVGKAGGWTFRRAAAAYRSERALLGVQEGEVAAARVERDAAERDLRVDATQQQAYQAHPGVAAADGLAAHVRDRIDAAVADCELFPSWFTNRLGYRPAPRRAADWREAAIQVVLYRITYAVIDRTVALGPRPEAGSYRRTRHDAVEAELHQLDE